MRKIAFIALALMSLLAPAQAQFAVTPAPAVIGGPSGSAVVPQQQAGGLLDIGQAFSASVAPFINAAVQGVLAAGLGWLAYWLKKRFDITITDGQRDTVQTWLTNQASSLIADGAVKIENGKVVVNKDALEAHAHQYATQIPDAAKFFGLTPEALAAKIIDKIPQVPAGAQMIAAPSTPAAPEPPKPA